MPVPMSGGRANFSGTPVLDVGLQYADLRRRSPGATHVGSV